MKNRFSLRSLMAALLVAVFLTIACAPVSLAERASAKPKCMVTMNLQLTSNLIWARYGVNVYLDRENLGFVPQGGQLLRIREIPQGVHTVTLRPAKSGIPETSFDIYVGGDLTLEGMLQTHRKFVGFNSLSLNAAGKVITYRDGDSISWSDFAQQLIVWMMVSGG